MPPPPLPPATSAFEEIEMKHQLARAQKDAKEARTQGARLQDKVDSMDRTLNTLVELLGNQPKRASQPLPSVERPSHSFSPSGPFRPVQPRPRLPSSSRPTPVPDDFTSYDPKYRAKATDPIPFSTNKGTIQYRAWKILLLAKFRTDHAQFDSEYARMAYLFSHTEGEAQEHLFPRFDESPANITPYTSYQEMLDTLDPIYENPYHVRDSRTAYKSLSMLPTQSFHDFKTRFIQLANDGHILEADRFDDMYDKLTTPLQDQLLNQLHTFNGDFNELCLVAGQVDRELRRLNVRRLKEREARELKNQTAQAKAPALVPRFYNKPLENRAPVQLPVAQRLSRPASPLPPQQEIKCYNCGEAGHMRGACPRPPRARADVKEIESEEVGDLGAYEDAVYEAGDPGKDSA